MWVSFPSWSEDSSFVTSKRNQYEEHLHRVEDERFQLDIVIETNLAATRVLEGVQKKLSRMSAEEGAKFRLDNTLGGSSEILHRKAIQRIYGDKAPDIIEGLKKNPVVAVPLVLRRLKTKEEEWREAQRGFNKIWREQNEKYYLKSLDHQGINFKQNDLKAIRSKALLNEIETIFDERQDQAVDSNGGGTEYNSGERAQTTNQGPHLTFIYKDKNILNDARDIIIHHMKRQTSIHKEDKQKTKQLLKHHLPDMFNMQRMELSDDEMDKEEDMDIDDAERRKEKTRVEKAKEDRGKEEKLKDISNLKNESGVEDASKSGAASSVKVETETTTDSITKDSGENSVTTDNEVKREPVVNGTISDADRELDPSCDEIYSLFFCNNTWYLFYRLHELLCSRLHKMHQHSVKIAEEESKCKKERKESTAVALRLKTPSEVDPEDYYPYFLDMIKNLLDGNLESNAYEDQLRDMFGIHAYIAFTMDKIVQNIVKQLQHLVSDDVCCKVLDLHLSEKITGATGGYLGTAHQRLNLEAGYQRKAEQILSEENCFKVNIYATECKLTLELLDTETENQDDPMEVERWSEYVEKYIANDETISDELRDQLARKPVFLPRNIRRQRQSTKKQQEEKSEVNSVESDSDKDSNKNDTDIEKAITTAAVTSDGKAENETDAKTSTEGDDTAIREGNVTSNPEETRDEEQSKGEQTETPKTAEEGNKEKELSEDMDIMDNTECKFNVNSFKIVYVVNSGSYLYKRTALTRARESHKKVSLRLHRKFKNWCEEWREKNVTAEQSRECNDWMMGRWDGLKQCKTTLTKRYEADKPPYYQHNKYVVECTEPPRPRPDVE